MTSSLNGSQSSSFVNVSHQSASSRTSYNFGVRSHSDTLSHDSEKKMPAKNVSSQSEKRQKNVTTNSKKISSQLKEPKPEHIKQLGAAQKKLIESMNLLLIININEARNKNSASEEDIQDCKEIISTTYAQHFHPTENSQRSFMNSLHAIQKNIQKITQQINQRKFPHDADDFTMVSDNATNLTLKEAMKNFEFKKDDFKNTRIQF